MAFLKVRLCSVLFSWDGGGEKRTHSHTLMANEVHEAAVCPWMGTPTVQYS